MKNAIYNKIKELAKKDLKISRADLASDLEMIDSIEINRLVWEAYNHFEKETSIKSNFINNDNDTSIVEDYELLHLIATGKNDDYFNALSKILENGNKALKNLDDKLKEEMSVDDETSKINNLLDTIIGRKNIKKVKNEATQAVKLYGEFVCAYDKAKEDVKEVANDFIKLRTEIFHIYEKYVQLLVDFYGDSIKSVAPSLFDFDTIEYLDTTKMYKKIKLQYDLLSENCSVLMSEISEGFFESVNTALQWNKKLNGYGRLWVIGIEVLNHYLDATEKSKRMKSDLEAFKMNIKKDVTNIKSDYARLAAVYKTINDLYIPKAKAYFRFSSNLLSDEFEQMVSTLYDNAGVAELVKERDKVTDEIRAVSDQINDHNNNIIFYNELINRCQAILTEKKDEFDKAQSVFPTKPSLFNNILTLGNAKKKYYRKMFKWHNCYGKLAKEYEKKIIDQKLYEADLKSHQDTKHEVEQKLAQLKTKQKELTDKILNTISVDTEMKRTLSAHLEDIINMLYVGKEILESGLDPKSIKAIKIKTFKSNELPEDIKTAVTNLKDLFKEVTPNLGKNVNEFLKNEFNEQEILEMNNIYDKCVNLIDAHMEYEALKEQNQATSEIYDKELERIQTQFNLQMADIDAKADMLGNVLKEINTAPDAEARKKALIKLTEGSKIFANEDELNKFFNRDLPIIL